MGAHERKRKEEDTELNRDGRFSPEKNVLWEVFGRNKKFTPTVVPW